MTHSSHVVGFFKKGGKTRPITVSDVQLLEKNSRKIKRSRRFRAIKPKIAAGGMARILDLQERKSALETEAEALRLGRDELSYQGDDVSTVTLQLREKISKLAKVKKAIRKLRRKKGVVKTW